MQINIEIPDEVLINFIQSAMEAGRTYGTAGWAQINYQYFRTYPKLLAGNGCIKLREINADETKFDGPTYTLNLEAIRRGVELMAKHKNKELIADLLADKFDGPSGDVLVQLAVLGEIRYG